MTYLWLKALHLAAAITWAGGMLMLSGLLGLMTREPLPHDTGPRRLMMAVYRWDRRVTNPALGLVWLPGLTLAWQGGWFSAHWLWSKLVLVTVLSALHGNQSATLRRLNTDPARPAPACMRATAGLTVAVMAAIVFPVILKPLGPG